MRRFWSQFGITRICGELFSAIPGALNVAHSSIVGLRLLFTKVGAGQSQLASPLAPPDVEKLAVPVLPTLIEHLLALPIFSVSKSPDSGPAFLRTLAGSRSLVLPFLAQWPHSSKSTPGFDIRACSLTTPPAITSVQLPEGHSVSLADFSTISSEEHDEIARLVIDFVTNHPTNPPALSLEQAREKAKVWMTPMWIYRAPLSTDSDGKDTKAVPVGFCNLGRPTPKTVAIRGVMVAQAARGRGIAERMVAHVARTYLVDARPEEHDPSFRNLSPTRHNVPTVFGRKDEVCLFVEEANDVARRVYKRVGFEESADRWGNWDLVGIEPGCW